ncbi:SPRY domain-containing SOCS box protein 3-like [Anneissia japonica]|uniref:SPRY domain-containing SOCS box protein 3-like n=1 Tax=Anneissia japonica TaxID=1529436 RepID=UPI001425636E|nr:SPRY domain-containing SOCS box protein 3-like [Anneissia japonica]XP_033118655.1 SPRY domain-containing SOCS box protein 3-like [Anneissia japonica]XP_033118656.1 SPRY domain-containing SOCS box protein 3-like [Anneissia japonica]XP_033118658.1 SPRY domain-containing SOCS box protein 3-like [Anneissia japonica]
MDYRLDMSHGIDEPPVQNFCPDSWTWDLETKSHECRLEGDGFRRSFFHPNWSNGTAGVRGTKALNGGHYYWEIQINNRVFGTSMMVGIGTKQARTHVDAFVNLLGENQFSWGLSHKGLTWHMGVSQIYTKPFPENQSTTIGVYFDGIQGTLSYYKDGIYLGVAFDGLDNVKEELYPMMSSTAAKTIMTLTSAWREMSTLQERCRLVIMKSLQGSVKGVEELNLPRSLKAYLCDLNKIKVGFIPEYYNSGVCLREENL